MSTPAPIPPHVFVSFVEQLPPHAQRLIVLGEATGKTHNPVPLYVETLRDCGWTPWEIQSFFLSDLLLGSIDVFRKKYKNNKQEALQEIIQRACPERRQSLSVELATHPGLDTSKPALHRLATFAQGLYDGTRTGCYLAALPIGYGKTRDFLLPFVIDCGKQAPPKGIIIAVERIEQVKDYAKQVNKDVGKRVAFPLVGHDKQSCPLAKAGKPYHPKECAPHHKRYAERAKKYPILFLTHQMLSQQGVEPYRTWKDVVTRELLIVDEKPALWWSKGSITAEQLLALKHHMNAITKEQQSTASVQALFRTITAAETTLARASKEQEIQLSSPLHHYHVTDLYQYIPSDETETTGEKKDTNAQLRHTLDSLYSWGQSKGVVVCTKQQKEVIVARRASLPDLPTLVLDGTGAYDPEYPEDITLLDIEPWEESPPPAKHIRLVTWDSTLTKGTKPDDPRWGHFIEDTKDIQERVSGPVYIAGAKAHKDHIHDKLWESLSRKDFKRLRFNWYGNTKGTNGLRDTVAVVFTSVQFKRDEYYQAIALATGKGGIAANARVLRKKYREYIDPTLQHIKLRDTTVTLVQEVGRTCLRENMAADVTALVPWADPQGVSALIHQLVSQFSATVTHEQVQRATKVKGARLQRERLLALLAPGAELEKDFIIESIGIGAKDKRQALRQLLNSPEIERELWGREVEVTRHTLHVPLRTQTQARIDAAKAYLASEPDAPLPEAA